MSAVWSVSDLDCGLLLLSLQVLAQDASCAPAWSLLVHVLQIQQQEAYRRRQHSVAARAASRINICCRNLCKADPMRAAYWGQMMQVATDGPP